MTNQKRNKQAKVMIDKLKVGMKYDRRIKLTPELKAKIRELYYSSDLITYNLLQNEFEVGNWTMYAILHPEYYEANKKKRNARNYYNKEKHKLKMRRYRQHKRELLTLDKISQ